MDSTSSVIMASNKPEEGVEEEPVPPPRRKHQSVKKVAKRQQTNGSVARSTKTSSPSRPPCPPPKPTTPPCHTSVKEQRTAAASTLVARELFAAPTADVIRPSTESKTSATTSRTKALKNQLSLDKVLVKPGSGLVRPIPKPAPRPRPGTSRSPKPKPLPRPRPSPRKSKTDGEETEAEAEQLGRVGAATKPRADAGRHSESPRSIEENDCPVGGVDNATCDIKQVTGTRTCVSIRQPNSDVAADKGSCDITEEETEQRSPVQSPADVHQHEVDDNEKDGHDYENVPSPVKTNLHSNLEKARSSSYENVPPSPTHQPVRLSQSLPHGQFNDASKFRSATVLSASGSDSYDCVPDNLLRNYQSAASVEGKPSSLPRVDWASTLEEQSDSEDESQAYVNVNPTTPKPESQRTDSPIFGIRKRSVGDISPTNDLSELRDEELDTPYNVIFEGRRRRNCSLDESIAEIDPHYQMPSSPQERKTQRSRTLNCSELYSHLSECESGTSKMRRPPPEPPIIGMRHTMKIRNMPEDIIVRTERSKTELVVRSTNSSPCIPEQSVADNGDLYSLPRRIDDGSDVTIVSTTDESCASPVGSDARCVDNTEGDHSGYVGVLSPATAIRVEDEDSDANDEYVDMTGSGASKKKGNYAIPRHEIETSLSSNETARPISLHSSHSGNSHSSVEFDSPQLSWKESKQQNATQTDRKAPPQRPPPPKVIAKDDGDGNNVYSKIDSLKREMRETVHSSTSSGAAYFSDTDTESEDEGQVEPKKEEGKGKLYYIANEILSTERAFVQSLKLVCEDFGGAVKRMLVKDPKALPDGAFNQMFLNIEQIYSLDLKFLQELEVRMRNWDEHQRIGDIIREYGHFLKIYTTYIRGYDHALATVQDNIQKMPKFASLVKEHERNPKFQSLKLTSFLLKPIQRIPSYRLLLLDYLKNLADDSLDSKDIADGVRIVSGVAEYINESMKEGEKFQDVLRIQSQILNSNEIVKPGRYLLKEGFLKKLSRKDTQERMFYLFTDALLYCSAIGHNQYKLILEMPLADISVHVPKSEDFRNEFSVISTKRSFMLAASSTEDRDNWMKALNAAIEEVTKKLVTFGLKKGLDDSFCPLPMEKGLGTVAPPWVPDDRVTMCMTCTKGFTVYNRRHHCRACGKVVCSSCSSYEAPLEYMDNEAVRVCEKCFSHLYHVKIYDETNGNEVDGIAKPSTPTQELSREEMQSRFRVIKTKKRNRRARKSLPSKLTEVMADEDSSIDSGHLRIKKGKTWKKYWFVLKDHVLYTYKAPSDPAALDTMPVLGFDLENVPEAEGDEYVFKLSHKGLKEPVIFKAENQHLKDRWMQCLALAITFEST